MKHKRVIVYDLVLLSILMGSTFVLNTFAADNTSIVDEISITVPISCTMSGTGTNTHYATIPNGIYSGSYTDPSTNTNYANGIGTTTITAFCNDNQGFSIYAIGYTDNEEGKNVLTNQTLGSTYDIVTGTATGPVGTNDISNWSMKLDTITSPTPTYPIVIQNSFDSYHEVPDDYTLVAKRESSTDVGQNAVGSTLTTTYAAYISKTQPAGLYQGQVKYTMVHPYDRVKPEPPMGLCTDSYTCMQQQTPASMAQKLPNVGDTVTLYDARDNQAYKVAKLADNKYWMVENLNIAGGTALSSEDTDFDSTYELPTTDGWTVADGKLILPASATKNPDNNNLADGSQFSTNNYAYVFNSSNKENCGGSGENTPCYSYYSWDAVTLGSGRTIGTENTDAPYSICPKNWRLPTSGSDSNDGWKRGDYYMLATNYGANLESNYNDSSSATGPNFFINAGPDTTSNFLFAGGYYGGSFNNGGNYSLYWSSTSYSNFMNARNFYFNSSYINSSSNHNRRLGFSTRCLFDK